MAGVTAAALEWLPARRSLLLRSANTVGHETWCDGLELLTQIIRVKASLDETLLRLSRCCNAAPPGACTSIHIFGILPKVNGPPH
jgi:hypothetical protein